MNTFHNEIADVLQQSSHAGASEEAARTMQLAQTRSSDHAGAACSVAERRLAGAPLAYAIGHKIFMGVELIVAEGALVPRQETELLGMTALRALVTSGSPAPRVIDMCSGSGNLACAIAHHMPSTRVWASDLTDGCVAVMRRNVEHVGVSGRVVVTQGDLFAGVAGLGLENTIDAIVCNPPYISQSKLASASAELLEHEPREAFDGGPYGLSIQQRVVKDALPFLRSGGILLFEVGLGQERQVKILFERMKMYEDISFVANAAGDVRVVSGRKRGM